MAWTIWKTVLDPTQVQEIEVPVGAEFLCAREQFDKICVWFKCNPANPKEARQIAIIGTGHDIPADGRYLGTASLRGGKFMFHVFECHWSDK